MQQHESWAGNWVKHVLALEWAKQGAIICSSKHCGLAHIAGETPIGMGLLVKVGDRDLMQEERDSKHTKTINQIGKLSLDAAGCGLGVWDWIGLRVLLKVVSVELGIRVRLGLKCQLPSGIRTACCSLYKRRTSCLLKASVTQWDCGSPCREPL